MYVSQHAIQRFNERILAPRKQHMSNEEVSAILLKALEAFDLVAVRVRDLRKNKRYNPKEYIWKLLLEAVYIDTVYFIQISADEKAVVTIYTEKQRAVWKVSALAKLVKTKGNINTPFSGNWNKQYDFRA